MTCDWVEKCEENAEYTIISTPDFTMLNLCYEHLIEYIEGLFLSNTENVWHLDVSRFKGGRATQ